MFGVNKGTYVSKKSCKRLGIGKETDPEAMSVSSLYRTRLPDVADRTRRNHHRRRSIDIEVKVFGKAVYHQRSRHHGHQRVDDEVICRLPVRAILRDRLPLAADHPHVGHWAILQPRSDHARASNPFRTMVNANWLVKSRPPTSSTSPAAGFGNVRRIGGHHAQQPFDQELLQEGRMAPYPMGQNQLSPSAQTTKPRHLPS